jgi:hypothetical protein
VDIEARCFFLMLVSCDLFLDPAKSTVRVAVPCSLASKWYYDESTKNSSRHQT